jgi:prepilin-type N-terminal cleavage/methylation domain-containing protein
MQSTSLQRGFTLMELGIVIAVMAVLSTVVIVGKGFIFSTKTSKAVDAIGVIRKAAANISALGGGAFPEDSSDSELDTLRERGFIDGPVESEEPWDFIPGFSITDVRWNSSTANPENNVVGVKLSCPPGVCRELYQMFDNDPNRRESAVGVLSECPAAAPAEDANQMVICFRI